MTTPTNRRDDPARKARDDQDALVDPPWVRVHRVQLIRREIREVLSPGAVEVLFDRADLVVEGGEELGGRRADDRRIYATVMVTLDLQDCAPHFREPADEATARRVAELMEGDPLVQRRLHTLAAQEAARLAQVEPESLVLAAEIAIRADGATVLVDIDLTATRARRQG